MFKFNNLLAQEVSLDLLIELNKSYTFQWNTLTLLLNQMVKTMNLSFQMDIDSMVIQLWIYQHPSPTTLLKCINGTKWKPQYTLNLVRLTIQFLFSPLTPVGESSSAWVQVSKMIPLPTKKCTTLLEKGQFTDVIFAVSASKLSG